MAGDNKSLGKFNLTGIPPAPMGMPQIEVTFDIDANGIVSVSAKDLGTGREQAMTITGGTALSSDEIDRMVNDAEKYAEEDRKRRDTAEARNQGDQIVHSTEKLLEEQADELNDDERTAIETALADLRETLGKEDVTGDDIRPKIEATLTASQALAQRLYAKAQEEAQATAGSDDTVGVEDDEEIVEAEIVDEGDDS